MSGFHLDEYVGIDERHPASFRRYLHENLTQRVALEQFFEINGSSSDPDRVQHDYVQKLRAADPQLCLLGIGENGDLAFNDPAEANFNDCEAMKIVTLDSECRQQQLAEGWFGKLEDIPRQAMTLTIPTILKVRKLIVSIPGRRKARSVRRTLFGAHCDSVPCHYSPFASGCNSLPGRRIRVRTGRASLIQSLVFASAIRDGSSE